MMKHLASKRRKRKDKASAYRELFLLPRYVVEEDGSKRKLEAGEYDERSQLYSLFTPISEMSDFGVGISMYFSSTRWMGMLLILAGVIQIPTVAYFQSVDYDTKNFYDTSYTTIGSAACVDEMRVCLNANCSKIAGEFRYPSLGRGRNDPNYYCEGCALPPWRDKNFKIEEWELSSHNYPFSFESVHSNIGDPSTFTWVGKRQCRLKQFFGTADFVMMVFVSISLYLLGRKQDAEAEEIDLAEQTAQDYSIWVSDPNPDCIDPDEWRRFFEDRFGDVFLVTVTVKNGLLLRLFKQKRLVENEMRLERIEEHHFLAMAEEQAAAVAALREQTTTLSKDDTSTNEAKQGSEGTTVQQNVGGEGEEKYGKEATQRMTLSDHELLSQLRLKQKSKTMFKRIMELSGLDPTLESLSVSLLKVKIQIQEELNRRRKSAQQSGIPRLYDACKVFVVFNSEQSQRACLEAMSVGMIPALLDHRDIIEQKYLFKGNLLHIHEAPEPSSVQVS